jgi:hypothetical protein
VRRTLTEQVQLGALADFVSYEPIAGLEKEFFLKSQDEAHVDM